MAEAFFATSSASCWTAAVSAPRPRRGWRCSPSSRASRTRPGATRPWATSHPPNTKPEPWPRMTDPYPPTVHASGATSASTSPEVVPRPQRQRSRSEPQATAKVGSDCFTPPKTRFPNSSDLLGTVYSCQTPRSARVCSLTHTHRHLELSGNEDIGEATFRPGDSVLQPPRVRHREIAHSDDLEPLEITSPAAFATEAAEPPDASR
jgi:hypothetical protein